MEKTTYYDYPSETYACREIEDTEQDKFVGLFGKFYGKEEHTRETSPAMTNLDADALTKGKEISKEEYEAL